MTEQDQRVLTMDENKKVILLSVVLAVLLVLLFVLIAFIFNQRTYPKLSYFIDGNLEEFSVDLEKANYRESSSIALLGNEVSIYFKDDEEVPLDLVNQVQSKLTPENLIDSLVGNRGFLASLKSLLDKQDLVLSARISDQVMDIAKLRKTDPNSNVDVRIAMLSQGLESTSSEASVKKLVESQALFPYRELDKYQVENNAQAMSKIYEGSTDDQLQWLLIQSEDDSSTSIIFLVSNNRDALNAIKSLLV
ncbi:MAG: hypothetical protein Q4E22_05855 [Coriobacteriia bacterium]|nr:hypothetical protein [Coriobacteriia bacterium]